jgi:hypothetical protein
MTARLAMMAAAVLLTWAVAPACAEDRTPPPPLDTNADEIAELLHDSPLAIYDPLEVFKYVLGQLPGRVQVYPTENYFYFRFVHKGVLYAGNIRLAAADRDRGKVDFSYNEFPTDWNDNPKNHHVVLGAEQGVKVEKAGPLLYRISHAGKTVTFALNDLSAVKPPADFLRTDEKYLGPIFDESGIRFFFIFNTRLKIFHFILDETTPVMDEFAPLKSDARILVGKRTGFALYQFDGRKILVGASERQSRLNTYFDGPFDQLPENFIEGDALRDAILAVDPGLRGKIDRLGYFADGSGRYLINPYMLYRQVSDLAVFTHCINSKAVKGADRPACFVIDDEEAQRPHPRPLALKRR